jgi:hypothetical protein
MSRLSNDQVYLLRADDPVSPDAAQNVRVCRAPCACAARVGHGGQERLLLNAVPGTESPQFVAPYSAATAWSARAIRWNQRTSAHVTGLFILAIAFLCPRYRAVLCDRRRTVEGALRSRFYALAIGLCFVTSFYRPRGHVDPSVSMPSVSGCVL